jgi:small-conductance mechanosensitive channel
VVEGLSLRTTLLRNSEGTLIVKTNGNIGVVRNMTKGWAQIDLKMNIGYSSDLTKALNILKEEGLKLKADFPQLVTGEPDVAGVDSFNESDITIRMFLKIKPGEQFAMKRQLNKRIKERFDKESIEIPFPQRVIKTITN